MNYVSGITSISMKDYILACIGTVPRIVVYTFIGTTMAEISNITKGRYNAEAEQIRLTFIIVGSVFGCAGILYTTVIVRKYIEKSLISKTELSSSEI